MTARVADDDFNDDVDLIDRIKVVPSILEVICQATGMGFAAVARVTEDRWVACSVRDQIGFGLRPGGELAIETTLCSEIRHHREPVVIDDVASDPVYRDHHTPKLYGLQSYISVPIILSDGSFFGTLCAIDPRPAQVGAPHIVGMFRLFAQMIGYHIETGQSAEETRNALLDEREASALREQFIAVLGHDLRNPLAGIQGGMRLLEKETLSARGTMVLNMVHDTVARMSAIIDNVMDFARGRLGSGIVLTRTRAPIRVVLDQVVAELRSSQPNREIVTTFDVDGEVDADHSRLGQLFSNLLGNALTHGAPDQPVRVDARIVDGHLELRTINGGDAIPPAAMARMFSPFSRGDLKSDLQGLGLGLYIASQIAEAHGGTLTVSSSPGETCFLFRAPLAPV